MPRLPLCIVAVHFILFPCANIAGGCFGRPIELVVFANIADHMGLVRIYFKIIYRRP